MRLRVGEITDRQIGIGNPLIMDETIQATIDAKDIGMMMRFI
jgi:hypothetical protein